MDRRDEIHPGTARREPMASLTPAEREFYSAHSATSDPGELAELLRALPANPEALADAVSGLVLHPVFVTRRRVVCRPESADDAQSRTVRAVLRRVLSRDSRPLSVRRAYEQRFVGTCRDYALLAIGSSPRVGSGRPFVRACSIR